MDLKQELKKYSKEELETLKHIAIKLKNKIELDCLKEHERATYDEVVETVIKSHKASPHEALGVGAQATSTSKKTDGGINHGRK